MRLIISCCMLLVSVTGIQTALGQKRAPPEEELRKWWTFKIGTRVLLLKPDYTENWSPEMNSFAGREAVVTDLLGNDSAGFYMLKVDVDAGAYSWRVRNVADMLSREAAALAPIYVAGTDIPLCVVPRNSNVVLHNSPYESAADGVVLSLESLDSAGRRWVLPRSLYVHSYSNNFLEVMESDLSSRKTLGWVKREDVHQWITRQGYIVNYSRPAARRNILVRGYRTIGDIGMAGKEVFVEERARARNTDPNVAGMPDGLLIGRNTEAYRGIDVVHCAFWNEADASFENMCLPLRMTFNPSEDILIPVALMSESELLELQAAARILYAACMDSGRVDDIRDALEKNWDLTGKVLVGTERRNHQFAQAYRRIQNMFPALTPGLTLPPGEAPERTFKEIGARAERIANNAGRVLDRMRRERRGWVWVSLAELY